MDTGWNMVWGIGDGGPWAIHPQSNVANIAILLRGVGGPPWTAPQRLVTGRDVWTGWCSGAALPLTGLLGLVLTGLCPITPRARTSLTRLSPRKRCVETHGDSLPPS